MADGEAAAPLWGGLTPGPYAVGYRWLCLQDAARVYDPAYGAANAGKTFRPILINLWYPARPGEGATPLRHGEYLDLAATEASRQTFFERLIAFNREVICYEVMGKEPEELEPPEREALEAFLETPTAAFPDAPAEPGTFPLVLNHPGLGGAFEDNSVLFEFLASHGYVVVNSAYPAEDAASVNINWDLDRSVKDLDYLLHYVQGESGVDLQRIGVMGQSYGGQAAMAYRAENNSPVDAVVSFDATIEYVAPDDPVLARLKARLDRTGNLSVPMLLFAQTAASPRFDIYEPMKFARRCYARAAHLQHNDFIAHGAVGSDPRRGGHGVSGGGVSRGGTRGGSGIAGVPKRRAASADAKTVERHRLGAGHRGGPGALPAICGGSFRTNADRSGPGSGRPRQARRGHRGLHPGRRALYGVGGWPPRVGRRLSQNRRHGAGRSRVPEGAGSLCRRGKSVGLDAA